MIQIHPAAIHDLDVQAAYYSGRGTPETANRWHDQAATMFEFLARQPGIGAVWRTTKHELTGVRV